MTEVNRIKCPKCGTTSVIYYGNDLYGCCNLDCEYKWKIPSIVGTMSYGLSSKEG